MNGSDWRLEARETLILQSPLKRSVGVFFPLQTGQWQDCTSCQLTLDVICGGRNCFSRPFVGAGLKESN